MTDKTFSLYLGLRQGTSVRMDVAARTALALDSYAKEIASFIDPFAQVSVEFRASRESSLNIFGALRALGSKAKDPENVRAAVVAVAVFITLKPMELSYERFLEEYVFGAEEQDYVKREEFDEILRILRALEGNKAANAARSRVYEEAAKDENVVSMGAAALQTRPDIMPRTVVPRSSFERFIREEADEDEPETRQIEDSIELTLISPVLLDVDRKWKFQSRHGPISAAIKDKEFLSNLLTGKIKIPMIAGVVFTVDLLTEEKKINGVWQPTDRSIVKVISVRAAPDQDASLFH